MKKIFIILLLLISISANCQYKYHQHRKEARNKAITTLAVQLGSIALEATGDALLDRGRYEGNQNMMSWGHALQAGSVATLFTLPLFLEKQDVLPFVGSYLFLRAGTFNPIYNSVRGVPWYYNGSTNVFDKAWASLNPPPFGKAWFNSLSIIVGVSININYWY